MARKKSTGIVKPKSAPSPPVKVKTSNPLIKTVAEVQAMTTEDKAAFRKLNGTTINNPI
tara:strand:+ start:1716 stop:1892 length:177 start_codon:yes stop_codon:yes gene_type:complete